MDAAVSHCTKGIGIWDWASNDRNETAREPSPTSSWDVPGDVPTQETLAAVDLLRGYFPDLKIASSTSSTSCAAGRHEHPHGLVGKEFDALFTATSRSSSPTTATRG
jgi:xylulose-5-phosphate/fructose-6-phosphate phosphoketolase